MYESQLVLDRIDDHVALVLVLGAVALLCNYVFFAEAARLARRDRCVPFLPLAVTLWFAHDANYLLNLDKWLNTYDHWFPQLFWVALLVTFSFECIFIVQTLRWGRRELAPSLSERGFRAYVLGAIALGVVFWAITKVTLDDPLYLMAFMLTAVWALGSNGALAVRRGTTEGQSVRQWVAFTGMITTYGLASIIAFGGEFQEVPWIVLCLTGVLGGIGMIWWLRRAPAPVPAAAADSHGDDPQASALLRPATR